MIMGSSANRTIGSPNEGIGAGRPSSATFFWLSSALMAEVLIVDFLQIPARLGFNGVAFGDYGVDITAQSLIAQGYRPGLDFAYPYGPLSLLFGKYWFALFHATPAAFFTATVACDLLFVA